MGLGAYRLEVLLPLRCTHAIRQQQRWCLETRLWQKSRSTVTLARVGMGHGEVPVQNIPKKQRDERARCSCVLILVESGLKKSFNQMLEAKL